VFGQYRTPNINYGKGRCCAIESPGVFDEADDDVVGVTVEVAAGPVIPGRHPGVAVSRGDLDIAQRDACVKAGGDEGYLP
jgi:hypothetical protein